MANGKTLKPALDMQYDIEADWRLLDNCNFSCEYCNAPDGSGPRIRMVGHRRKHGPAERRNLESFTSPIETDDMSAAELTSARQQFVHILRNLAQPGQLAGSLEDLAAQCRHTPARND